jgi:16S rRNA (guanine966-N2)-methyltransferase
LIRLRIISGFLKGRFISVPETNNFRPTLERTRESVAEIIKNKLDGAIVADICAGSGAFGFEMLSRGASSVDFIEKDRHRAAQLIKTASQFGLSDQTRVISRDVNSFIKSASGKYDIIFYDPPYDDKDLMYLHEDLVRLLNVDGILLYESRKIHKGAKPSEKKIIPFDIRTFGETVVEFYGNTNQ